MARHSEVLIQGGNVPGGSFTVNVPVDCTFASDAARNIYPYDGAQYIWMKSWDTDQPSRGGGGVSASGGGGCATLFWVVVGIVAIGVFGGGESEDSSPSAPQQSYNAPVERVVPAAPEPQWEDYATPPPSYCVNENFEPC